MADPAESNSTPGAMRLRPSDVIVTVILLAILLFVTRLQAPVYQADTPTPTAAHAANR